MCSILLIVLAIFQLRKLTTHSKVFHLWGAISIGGIASLASLNSSQISTPEWLAPLLFSSSGIIFAFSIIGNRTLFPAKNRIKQLISLGTVLYLLVCFSGLYSALNGSLLFPIVMSLGYLPVLFLSSRFVDKDYFRAAAFSGILVFSTLVLAQTLLYPDSFYGVCRLDKCSVWGSSIGNLSSGNALGLSISFIGIIGIALAQGAMSKIQLGLSALILIDAASGRTATVAYIASVILFFVLVQFVKLGAIRKIILGLVVILSGLFSLIPFSPDSFTYRGQLWIFAREEISKNIFFGYGASSWVRQNGSSSYALNYSSHNLWLEAAYSIGLVGLVVFAITFIGQTHVWKQTSGAQMVLFLWIIFSGLTEVPTFLSRMYLIPGALVLYFMLGSEIQNFQKHKSRRNDESSVA